MDKKDMLNDIIVEYSTMRSLEVSKSRQEESKNKKMSYYHQGKADALALVLVKLDKLKNL
tara:strand:+ start:151 stop:330 length:180 start_codon:yes stop_codon:yes gene_type:complete